MTTRAIGASNAKGLVYGRSFRQPLESPAWWQRLLGIQYHPGQYFEMESVDEPTALRALDDTLADGHFSIVSESGGKMNFYLIKETGKVWIDCWFFDSNLDEIVISREGANRLVQFLYTSASDDELLTWLKSEGAALIVDGVAV